MRAVAALALVGVLEAPPASAQPASAASPQVRAAELNAEAATRARRGEWAVASAMLEEAYGLTRDPALLVNLAATELKAGRGVEALRHVRAYLADPKAEARIKDEVAAQLLPRAMAATAHLTLRIAPGAIVSVDGERLVVDPGAPAAACDVAPGEHRIEVSAGGAPSVRTLVARAGEALDVDARAAPGAPPPPPEAPAAAPVEEGFWTARHVVPLGMLAGAAVAGGFATGFALGASGAASDARSCGAGCPTYDHLHSTYDLDSSLATGLTIGALALAAGAVVTWIVWPAGEGSARAYVTTGSAGVAGVF